MPDAVPMDADDAIATENPSPSIGSRRTYADPLRAVSNPISSDRKISIDFLTSPRRKVIYVFLSIICVAFAVWNA